MFTWFRNKGLSVLNKLIRTLRWTGSLGSTAPRSALQYCIESSCFPAKSDLYHHPLDPPYITNSPIQPPVPFSFLPVHDGHFLEFFCFGCCLLVSISACRFSVCQGIAAYPLRPPDIRVEIDIGIGIAIQSIDLRGPLHQDTPQ